MEELGLDMQTSVAILQMAPRNLRTAQPGRTLQLSQFAPAAIVAEPRPVPTSVLYQNDVVDQILAELEAEMAPEPAQSELSGVVGVSTVPVSVKDFQLLSRYFASAALPALQAMAEQL